MCLPEVRDAFMKFEDIIYYERRDAILDTKIQDICELLEEHGEIPEELKNRLDSEKDVKRLAAWHKLAAKSHSIEEFMEAID